jgi:alkyl sulfatase BDS1-like metallo-beta-lactamase superfamily hydrolase
LRDLEPEIFLATHSTPLVGADIIAQRLRNYRDGIAFTLDQSLKGILLGQGPDELRYSVQLPKRLQTPDAPILIQNYGDYATLAPRIFTAIFGQFDRNAATLNKLHPREEAQRMVVAMGGESSAYEKSMNAFNDGDYLWAGQIADYLVKANDVAANRQLKADCLRQMGYRALAQNTRSWYLSQARDLEGVASIIQSAPATPEAVSGNLADYVNFYRVRISPERSADTDMMLGIRFEGADDDHVYGLHVRRSVVDFIPELATHSRAPDVTVAMLPVVWTAVFHNLADPLVLIDQGDIQVVHGEDVVAKELFAMFDPVFSLITT